MDSEIEARRKGVGNYALKTATPLLNLALAAASAGSSQSPHEQAVSKAVMTAPLAGLSGMVASIFDISDSDVVSIQAFPDVGASQAGATGGM